MLELQNVTVRYGEQTALKDVSLAFRPGEVLAVIGPNGGGKSTLLRAAAGLLPVSEGERTLDGEPLSSYAPKELARRVAYLPQSRDVPDITVWSLVLHGRFPHMGWPRRVRKTDKSIAAAALSAVDGTELAARSLRELSGGQRQKAYIAMALAQETDTILLDEPTTYLDIAHQLQVTELARKLAAQGKAVGIVLHDLPQAMETADRLAVLDAGRLVAADTPEDIYDSGVLPRVFGVALERFEAAAGRRYVCGREVL